MSKEKHSQKDAKVEQKEESNNKESKQEEVKELTCEEKLVEMTNLLQNLQADFQNYRKRVEKEKEQTMNFVKKNLILKILPSLDMFELSLVHKDNHEQFVQGVEMIRGQLKNFISQEGFVEIKETKFDPLLHEAIDAVPGELDTVVEIVQKGYKLNDQVIRCARVRVGNGKKDKQ